MAKINPNFNDYIKRIKNDLNSGEIRKEFFDKIYKIEELKL